jgi:hypothetical protein
MRRISPALILIAGLVISVGCQKSSDAAKWFARSHDYKSEVLAQPSSIGELRHIEWDGWGWAGQDTTVYLVFDPEIHCWRPPEARNRASLAEYRAKSRSCVV